MRVEFHSETNSGNSEFHGTITLSVDGKLAIVKVAATEGNNELKKNWLTVPTDYDFTVHHVIVWRNGVAAASIIIMVYGNNGELASVTAVHNY